MEKIPSAEEVLNLKSSNYDYFSEELEFVKSKMIEFAIEILKYNLKQYKTQMFQFNTGEASVYKSFDTITLETIKELEK